MLFINIDIRPSSRGPIYLNFRDFRVNFILFSLTLSKKSGLNDTIFVTEVGKRSKTDILSFPFVKNRLLLNKEDNFFVQKCPYLYKGRTCTFIESQYPITLCALAFFIIFGVLTLVL